MEVKPIKMYKTPHYPAKKDIEQNKRLLSSKPKRWIGKANISVALSTLVLLMNTACSQKIEGSDTEIIKKQINAPIFEHGSGRGGYGCVSVAPPAFLSEEEAFQIIQEEVKKEGLNFENNTKELNNIRLPKTDLNPKYDKDGNVIETTKTKRGILKVDGYDSEANIGFEFVSKDDVIQWSNSGSNSTYESYDMLNAAKVLEESLKKEKSLEITGIFYDPVSYFTKNGFSEEANKIMKNNEGKWENIENQFKNLSKEDLREQVKEFLSWLKSEGII